MINESRFTLRAIPKAHKDVLKRLDKRAKKLGISVIGSLALLKSLYQKRIIKTRKEYLTYLETLQEDIYLSEKLMKWALEE